ncbi:MAG: polysaccharide biosynthesis tyrosine autokinase [Flavobacteriales bacterium]|nr:polysaccharide biosynthesis tyrosine autokinase [Flavobacteriales bacterium]
MATSKPTHVRGSIIDAKDLRVVLRVVSKNWYIVVVALILSAVLSFLYSYRLSDVYGASTQILLKDREVYNYQSQVYQSIGYVGVYGDLVNQKRVMTSYDLINTALNKLDFDISYYVAGRFKTKPVYGNLPFTVKLDLLDAKLYDKPFDLRIIDLNTYELAYERAGELVRRQLPFGEYVEEKDFNIEVQRAGYLNPENIDNHTQTDYKFIRHARNSLIARIKGSMQVTNYDYTTILQVTVEDEVAIRAKMFLDTLSRVYINYTLKSEFDINENTLNYIDKQLDEVTAILEVHEDELERFRRNKDVLNLNKEENLYFNEMVDYDHRRRTLLLERQSLDALEDYVRNSTDEHLLPPSVFVSEDLYLKQTVSELYSMQMQRIALLQTATEQNESVRKFDEQFNLNRSNLLTYVKNARIALDSKINDVQKQMRDFESMLRRMPENQRELLNIERRMQVNEKMYLFLLEKRATTTIARAGIVPQTKVIESARIMGVVRPDKMQVLYTFLLGGLVVAMIVVFTRIMFYDRIENAEQLKELTTLPIYGEIIASEKAEDNYVVVDSDPKAAITESFRSVRTNLEYVPGPEDKGKVVMLTSYRPNEGKTFCSVNLSTILSKAGKRVLLLEMDLHKPKVAEGLGMSSPNGLSNVLVGRIDWRQAVMPTQFENMDVMLSGPTPPNASELVLSKHLERLFDEAKLEYDYIIVDTPPVGLITDALLMMRLMDATLFVINTRFANKDHVNNAIEVLTSGAGKNCGFILNGVRMKKSKYYYNTNYGYGYRYAYGYGSGYGYGYGYGRKRSAKGAGGDKKQSS